jgi:hypothetical protein
MADPVLFAATKVAEYGVKGFKHKEKTFTLQLPSVWAAAGISWNLSAEFSVVTGCSFGPQNAIGANAYIWGLIGTATTAGDGITASTVKLTAHENKTGAAPAVEAFPAVADDTDLKAITALRVTVRGY